MPDMSIPQIENSGSQILKAGSNCKSLALGLISYIFKESFILGTETLRRQSERMQSLASLSLGWKDRRVKSLWRNRGVGK